MKIETRPLYAPVLDIDKLLRGEPVDLRSVVTQARQAPLELTLDLFKLAMILLGFLIILSTAGDAAYWLGAQLGHG